MTAILVRGEEQLGGLVILRSKSDKDGLKPDSASTSKKLQPTYATVVHPKRQTTEEETEEDVRHMEAELSQLRQKSRHLPHNTLSSFINIPGSHQPLSVLNEQDGQQDIPLEETPVNQKNKKLRSHGRRLSGSKNKRSSSSLGNTGVLSERNAVHATTLLTSWI